MSDENTKIKGGYVVLQKFMLQDLKLKGTELLVYAIIYGFSQNGDDWFTGRLQYLMDWAQVNKRNIIKTISSLLDKHLLIKCEEYRNNVKFVKYQAVIPGESHCELTEIGVNNTYCVANDTSGVTNDTGVVSQTTPIDNLDKNTNPLVEDSRIRIRSSIRNINITHTPTTHTPISTAPLGATCQEKPQNDAPQVFEDKNEATFQKFWNAYPDCKRKTNRKACKTALLNVPNLEQELPKILEGLEAWKKDSEWSKEGGQYIPAPLVFIHQRKWEGILKHAEQKKKEDEILKNMFFGDEKIFDDN